MTHFSPRDVSSQPLTGHPSETPLFDATSPTSFIANSRGLVPPTVPPGTKFKKKGFKLASKQRELEGKPLCTTISSCYSGSIERSSLTSLTEAATTSTEDRQASQFVDQQEALLSEHRKAVQKVLADSCERAVEAIMQQTSQLQAAAIRNPCVTAERLLKASKESETSGNDAVRLRPEVMGKQDVAETKMVTPCKVNILGTIAESDLQRPAKLEEKDRSPMFLSGRHGHFPRASKAQRFSQDVTRSSSHDSVFELQDAIPQRGLFADADAMKKQLRDAMTQKTYDVADFYWTEGWCQAIARHPYFEMATLGVISFNAIWIAVDVDHNPATVLNDAEWHFVLADIFFCIYFIGEWLIRFGAFQRKKDTLKDRWFMFDSGLCGLMFFETCIMPLIIAIGNGGNGAGGPLGDASLLKGFRLVRLIRMARVIRLLNALPELMVLIKGMRVACRAVSCTVALLLIIIYVFAVALRQITDGTKTGKRDFSTVMDSVKFLLIQGTMPDLEATANRIWDENVFYAFLFFSFVLVVSITVMNMLVGVLVGVVNTVASVEKEQLMVEFVKTNLLELMRHEKIDEDNDGLINRNEFDVLIQNPAAIRSFNQMGVDVVGLVDLADFIFKDASQQEGHEDLDRSLPFGDFMEVIMSLRGSNQATVKDIVDLRKCIAQDIMQMRGEICELSQETLKNLAGQDINACKAAPKKTLPRHGSSDASLMANKSSNEASAKFNSEDSMALSGSAEEPKLSAGIAGKMVEASPRSVTPEKQHSESGGSIHSEEKRVTLRRVKAKKQRTQEL